MSDRRVALARQVLTVLRSTSCPAASLEFKPRWPFGYRVLLWLVGSVSASLLVSDIVFLLNAPR